MPSRDAFLCPVSALQAFLQVRPMGPTALFCHFDGLPLTRHQFNAVLRKALEFSDLGGITSNLTHSELERRRWLIMKASPRHKSRRWVAGALTSPSRIFGQWPPAQFQELPLTMKNSCNLTVHIAKRTPSHFALVIFCRKRMDCGGIHCPVGSACFGGVSNGALAGAKRGPVL